MPQQALPKTYSSITHLYIYIYIHQSRPYQHLRTLNHPLVIILLENSNNQSCVTYISSYCPPNQISTVHSEEIHVVGLFSKFHPNRTVNEPRNAVLQKLRKLEKVVAPSAQKWKVGPGGTVLPLGGSCCTKSTKTTFFMNQSTPHISGMAPGGNQCPARRFLLF